MATSQKQQPNTSRPLDEILNDLASRFVLNCPAAELEPVRIFFSVELAHWYYCDTEREQNTKLPNFSLREFALKMFQTVQLLSYLVGNFEELWTQFSEYKKRVPVFGAILLNTHMDKCLLVRGWKSRSTWSFPRGKVNQGEEEMPCAIREVYEETGYPIPPADINENDSVFEKAGEQQIKLYIVKNVPEDFPFCPRTKKEIGEIGWHSIEHLEIICHANATRPRNPSIPTTPTKNNNNNNQPNTPTTPNMMSAQSAIMSPTPKTSNFFMALPFIPRLLVWIDEQKRPKTPKSSKAQKKAIPRDPWLDFRSDRNYINAPFAELLSNFDV